MVPRMRDDTSEWLHTLLGDEAEAQDPPTGPQNAPVPDRLYRAASRLWLTQESYTMYLRWSSSADDLHYRKVLGGRFIRPDHFIQTGLGELVQSLTTLGWIQFATLQCQYSADRVRQFYTNLYEDNGHYHTMVESTIISFTPTVINELVGAPDEGSRFCTQGSFLDIVDLARVKELLFPSQMLTGVYHLRMTHFQPLHRIAYALVTEIFCPRGGHHTDITHMGLHWLVGILFQIPINLGSFICRYMIVSQQERKHMLPYGRLITLLLHRHGVGGPVMDDTTSRGVMGDDYFRDNKLVLAHGRWMYRRSALRAGSPGAATTAIYDDEPRPSIRQRARAPPPIPAAAQQQPEHEPEPAPARQTGSSQRPRLARRTHEQKSLHRQMTEMRQEMHYTRSLLDFYITSPWTAEQRQAFEAYRAAHPFEMPAGSTASESEGGDDEDTATDHSDDEADPGVP